MDPVGHVDFTARMLAATACSRGDLLVYDSASGYWEVATTDNRGTKRCEAIALTAYGGSEVGKVKYQAAGIVSATISGLASTASKSLVRCSSTGTIERIDAGDVDTTADDIIGYAEADGRVHLMFGLPLAELVTILGGGGATPGGSTGDVQTNNGAGGLGSVAASTAGNQLIVNSAGAWVSGRWIAGACTLEQFGAVGDGVTSDQAAFEAARAALAAGTYSTLILGAKTYLVEGTTSPSTSPWPYGISIIGQGSGASCLKTTTDARVLAFRDTDAADRAKSTLVQGLRFEGNSTGTNQYGVSFGYLGSDGTSRARVIDVTALNMGGTGFQCHSGPTIGSGPQFIGCRAISCATGFDAGDQSNYVACQAVSCTLGIYVSSGNVSWVGGDITGCTTAINILAGGNDGHGIFCGAQINHNTTALNAGALSNGHTFVGCHFYQGNLTFGANTGMIQFDGCVLDITTYSFTSSKVRFTDCRIDQAYFTAYNESGSPEVEWLNCREMDGTIPSFIGDRTQVSFTFASDANDTLTAQEAIAETLIVGTGTITASRQITNPRTPAKGVQQRVINNNAQAVTYKWATGTAVTINAGTWALVGADGTNALKLES